MGVNPTTFTRLNNRETLSGDIERCNGQDEPKSREGTHRANLRFLTIPTVGLVIEKIFFNVEAQPIVFKGRQMSGLITDNGPTLSIDVVTSDDEMNRAIPLRLV